MRRWLRGHAFFGTMRNSRNLHHETQTEMASPDMRNPYRLRRTQTLRATLADLDVDPYCVSVIGSERSPRWPKAHVLAKGLCAILLQTAEMIG